MPRIGRGYRQGIEVTKREVLVSIIIVLVMVGIGFLISTKIQDKIFLSNEKYFKALKIEDDEELFSYAINTEVGNMLSYGTVVANEPVVDEKIDGEYFSIKRIEEHYVRKEREVTYTDDDGNVHTKIEVYYEWDEVKRDVFSTETFDYLGQTYDYDFIKFDSYRHNETVKDNFMSSVRFKYYTIPVDFSGSLYSNAKDKTIQDNEFYQGSTLEELLNKKEKEGTMFTVVFWIIWTLLTGLAVFGFVGLDNKYLNGK